THGPPRALQQSRLRLFQPHCLSRPQHRLRGHEGLTEKPRLGRLRAHHARPVDQDRGRHQRQLDLPGHGCL
ncbi:hypothetical protein LTR16_005307, partial [Cryomyces antarcticus]